MKRVILLIATNFAVLLVLWPLGIGREQDSTAGWWLLRPVVIGLSALVLAGDIDVATAREGREIFLDGRNNCERSLIEGGAAETIQPGFAGFHFNDDEARALGVEDVYRFAGFRKGVEDFYSILDVFVMSSEEEALGSSVLDAFRTPANV